MRVSVRTRLGATPGASPSLATAKIGDGPGRPTAAQQPPLVPTQPPVTPRPSSTLRGLGWALLSCLAFGMSGTLAKGLMVTGWSPLATVTVRVGGAALLMGIPALWFMRRRLRVVRAHAGLLLAYGTVAVAATQLCYFVAVQTLPVALALLIEYLAPVLIVGWLWARHGQRPNPLTAAGVLFAMTGLALVLGITGAVSVDVVGLGWALAAAVSLAGYFVLSARPTPDLPPLVLVGAGMGVAAGVLGLVAVTGALEWTTSSAPVALGQWVVSPLVPLALLALVTAVFAYTTGLFAARALGSRVASFVSLIEVLAAVGFAWLFLGELPTAVQLLGGVAIVLGAAAVKAGEAR